MSWFTVLRLLLYRSVLELFSKSFKVFHCSVINVRCCYFQQLVYFIISSSRCQQLFYFSLLSLKRDNSDILSCLSLFVNNFFKFFIKQGYKDSNLEMTESESVALPFGDSPIWSAGGGIRTHAPLRTNGFQDRLVMTTSISLQSALSNVLLHSIRYLRFCQALFKTFFTFFYIFFRSSKKAAATVISSGVVTLIFR